jgi:hypothetical protein
VLLRTHQKGIQTQESQSRRSIPNTVTNNFSTRKDGLLNTELVGIEESAVILTAVTIRNQYD